MGSYLEDADGEEAEDGGEEHVEQREGDGVGEVEGLGGKNPLTHRAERGEGMQSGVC